MERSEVVRRALRIQAARLLHDSIIFDESWFYLMSEHESIWLAQGYEIHEREQSMIESSK
jgi:hypothetical protein